MDKELFLDFSYGNYIVSTTAPDGRLAGAAMNTVFQLTEEPFLLAICFNHVSATGQYLRRSGQAAVTVLDETVSLDLEDRFGMQSSAQVDKFEGVPHALAPNGAPYLTEHALSWFSGPIRQVIPLPTHDLFLMEVTHCGRLGSGSRPMTYALYRQRKALERE